MIINGDVYDISKFANVHPGGAQVLLDYGGKDATEAFYALHRHEVLEKFGPKLKVGQLQGYDNKLAPSSWKSLSNVPYAEVDM